jgi:short-subunit dehydrogenase
VLVDQNEEDLKVQAEMTKEKSLYNDIDVVPIAFDFKGSDKWQLYQELQKKIAEITKSSEVSVLINNAEEFDTFGPKIHRAKDEDVLGNLTINTFPMVFMTRFLGPDMKARSSKGDKKSAIINMTSYYSEFAVTNAPLYSSAKAFEDVFS